MCNVQCDARGLIHDQSLYILPFVFVKKYKLSGEPNSVMIKRRSRGGTTGTRGPTPPPLENYKGVGFLRNTGMNRIESHKLPSQHSVSGCRWPNTETLLR